MWLDFWPAVWRVGTWRTPSWPFCWYTRVVRRVHTSSLPTHTGSWWAFFRLLQLGLHWCSPDITVVVDWASSTKLLTYLLTVHTDEEGVAVCFRFSWNSASLEVRWNLCWRNNPGERSPEQSLSALLLRPLSPKHFPVCELRSCVKVKVAVLGSPTVHTVSVDVKQHWTQKGSKEHSFIMTRTHNMLTCFCILCVRVIIKKCSFEPFSVFVFRSFFQNAHY